MTPLIRLPALPPEPGDKWRVLWIVLGLAGLLWIVSLIASASVRGGV